MICILAGSTQVKEERGRVAKVICIPAGSVHVKEERGRVAK